MCDRFVILPGLRIHGAETRMCSQELRVVLKHRFELIDRRLILMVEVINRAHGDADYRRLRLKLLREVNLRERLREAPHSSQELGIPLAGNSVAWTQG